ncbi:MAG: SMP-30/gluconolactonase/LRE family protein, partial [Pseudomonadales bacterium]|nr:SMP-30/gluconolactonase/LRE family protein [Pseudomonadales bacterium]
GIEIRDSRLLDIVSEDTELEVLGEGFGFTEGPIWHPQDKHLTFSDIPSNRMHRWSEATGVTVYREPSNLANGNTYDKEGRILSCEHGTSRVVREEHDGTLNVLASHWDDKELNSPNDIVVRSNGDIFFTDPTFGRADHTGIPRELELDFRGVYKIDGQSGELTLLRNDFTQPNGLAFTQDERYLYVADTPEMHIRKFDVSTDGTLSGGDVFTNSTGEGAGAPDGLKVDSNDNVYCCGPGGVHVYAPDGICLGVIQTPAFCANFTWGDDDFLTFYMTSSNHLYRIPVKVPGVPLFR